MEKSTNSDFKFIKTLSYLFLTSALLCSTVFLIIENSSLKLNYNLTKMGAFGDFIGGFLNPIFSFLAIMGLLLTIKLQIEELRFTREELKGSREESAKIAKATERQNIENAFFQLLNHMREVSDELSVKFIDWEDGNIKELIENGPAAFKLTFYQTLERMRFVWTESDKVEKNFEDSNYEEPEIITSIRNGNLIGREAVLSSILYGYNSSYTTARASLGRYFRVLYNVLRFLDEKEKFIEPEFFKTYYKIVRANLTDFELAIIYFNCLTDVGQPMIKYVEKFKLFDNLPTETMYLIIYNNQDVKPRYKIDLLNIPHKIPFTAFGRNSDLVSGRNFDTIEVKIV